MPNVTRGRHRVWLITPAMAGETTKRTANTIRATATDRVTLVPTTERLKLLALRDEDRRALIGEDVLDLGADDCGCFKAKELPETA